MIKLILSYYKNYKKHFIIYTVSSILAWGIAITLPYFTGYYIDLLLHNVLLSDIIKFASIVIVLNIINQILRYFSGLMATKLGNNVSFSLSYDLFERLKRVSLEFHKKVDAVYLSERISSDSTVLINFFLSNSVSFITSLLSLVFGLSILCKIDYFFASFIIILVPLYILTYKLFKTSLFKANYSYIERQSEYYSLSSQQFKNIRFIKINSLYREIAIQLQSCFKCYLNSIIKNYNINFVFSNLTTLLLILSNGFIVFYGGLQVSKGNISIGQFTIINTYFNMIINSITFFMGLGSSYQQSLASYKRIQEYLNLDLEYNSEKIIKKINDITIDNLKFKYDNNNKIFDSFSYKFKTGNIYIIQGKNGSGKSTLINILCGLYTDKYEGNICINEHNIKELDLVQIRYNLFSVTQQEPILLKNTILNNLTLGVINEPVNLSVIERYCSMMGISNKINNLPEKYNTIISESNTELSGGEKQKIALIRSFLKKFDVLILDEPTSALDQKSINALKKILSEIKLNKIIIIITHDSRIMDISDQTVNIENLHSEVDINY